MSRDLNQERKDTSDHEYAYDFDWVVRKYLLKRVARYFPADAQALELGCFEGDMTQQILGYLPKLTVIEGSSELCNHVRKRFPGLNVIKSTFEDAQVDRQYDVVFLVHTLEHLDDRIGLLRKIRGWLKPDGKLILAVPNANALSRQLAVKMGLIDHHAAITPAEFAHGHRITYTHDMLHHEIRQAGLSVRDQAGILVKPLANFQFDRALKAGIIDDKYLDACYELGAIYPDLCATLVAVCEHPAGSTDWTHNQR